MSTLITPTNFVVGAAECPTSVPANPLTDAAACCGTYSVEVRALLASTDQPGVARRIIKLSRQVSAAERLLARGADCGLEPPSMIASLGVATRRIPEVTLSDVDTLIARWAGRVVELHRWRGHTASLPATKES